MNNKQLDIIKRKVDKFSNCAHLRLWHNNALAVINHRFSYKRSNVCYDMRYIEFPNPSQSSEVFIATTMNDIVLLNTRLPFELEKWGEVDPRDVYEQVAGEMPLFQIDWELIEAVPTSLTTPLMELFKDYYGVVVDYPILTIGVVARIPHEIYNGGVIYLPNSSLFPEEFTWALAMQKAYIDGREIPPRPEVCLGMKLSPLYEGLEWNGEGAE